MSVKLTVEEMKKEILKCGKNPTYFLRNYAKITHPERGNIPFKTYPFQDDLLEKFRDHRFNVIAKARQLGISTIVAGYIAWMLLFYRDKNILVMATKYSTASNMVKKVKHILGNVPDWLTISKVTIDNKHSFELSNGSQVKAIPTSPDAGRSEAVSLLVVDEAAHVENMDEIWTAIYPTISTGGRCIALSSPNGIGNWFHRTFEDSLNGQNGFISTALPWSVHPEHDQAWFDNETKNLSKREIAQEYLINFNASGETVIDPDDIERLRKSVSEPKKKSWMDRNYFVWKPYNHQGKYLVCLPEGESVLTHAGIKKIENIDYDNYLINKEGNLTKIVDIKTRLYDGDIYEIFPSNTFRSTKFTDEHPIYVSSNTKLKRNYDKNHSVYNFNERYWDFDFNFIDAKNVRKNDWIQYPNIYKDKFITNDEILEKWKKYDDISRIDFRLNQDILLNKKFWWFIGFWLAEGWITNSKTIENSYAIHVCCSSIKEKHLSEKIKIFSKEILNRETNISYTEKNTINMKFNSKQLYFFINDNFGKYSGGKNIPEWVKMLPKELKISLLDGYFTGDGCIVNETRRNKKESAFVSISLKLLEDVQEMLFSMGCISSLQKLRNAKKSKVTSDKLYNIKETYQLRLGIHDTNIFLDLLGRCEQKNILKNKRIISNCFFSKDEKFIYFKVKKVKIHEKYSGIVYNFTTDTGTFLTRNITTHNCADVARGDGQDYSVFHVINVNTMEQVAEYQGRVEMEHFTNLLFDTGVEYGNAMIVVENNNIGYTVAQKLGEMDYKNLFYSHKSSHEYVHPNAAIGNSNVTPGFNTSVKTRPLIIAKLDEMIRNNAIHINSPRLVRELEKFIWVHGRPEAQKGYNDDLVMALAIACWVRDTTLIVNQKDVQLNVAILNSMTRSKTEINTSINGMNNYKEIATDSVKAMYKEYMWLLKG